MATSDGRDTRWEQHRQDRRRELVSHALRAIRSQGAGVGMEEIAVRAGTSKTVIYRHFGDRAGLYAAVVESVHDYIHARISERLLLADAADLGKLVADLADAYLGLVERDPEIYRFVLARPATASSPETDATVSLVDMIGNHVTAAIAGHLAARGLDDTVATTWGHGLTGFIRAAADHWMASPERPPRAQVVQHISSVFTPGFAGAMTGDT
ncbi:TetR/AcrR family transcriptional regulator [Demequina pelophila]|uniref:TetR/AcrR family transcriptional regulator n=1 Tax=Demequina pelophila TaxID=1638984 RepID=UPI00078138F8|nr:TetR/AcrR family transcriptional regulator [Demequina pelophila]